MSVSIETIIIAIPDGSENFYTVDAEITREGETIVKTVHLGNPKELVIEIPEPEPEVITQVKIDELAASKLFLSKRAELTAWINTSHYKDILKAIIGRQNSALDRELCLLLTDLIQEEIDSEDVTLSEEDGQYFITVLESVVAALPPLPEPENP